jgi:predicted enzyme related to lactoylglutathione lyase
MSRPRLITTSPLLVVNDLGRSIDFYAKLGFTCPGTWGEPPCFAMIHRDDLELMLSLSETSCVPPTPNGPQGQWDLYFRLADVDAEADELRAAGIAIDKGPTDTVYEMREIEVVDPDGYRICLAHDLSDKAPSEEWAGTLDVGSARLRLLLRIVPSKGSAVATMDSPDQGASHLAVELTHRDDTSLRFTMEAIDAAYEGTFDGAGKTVTGTWTQRGRSWPLVFARC